jgi:hypothetical protein
MTRMNTAWVKTRRRIFVTRTAGPPSPDPSEIRRFFSAPEYVIMSFSTY